MRPPLSCLFLIPLLAAGCGGKDAGSPPGDGEKLPATDYLLVQTGDGLVLTGEVPRITIVEADEGLAQIEVGGEATDEDGTRLWYFYARLVPEDLVDGFAEGYPVLGSTATTPRIVNVGIESPPGPTGSLEVARAGTASMQWFDGWFKGQIVNDDPRMAADFKGGYQVSCSYLNPDGGRIVDTAFESQFCARFAGIRPPDPASAP